MLSKMKLSSNLSSDRHEILTQKLPDQKMFLIYISIKKTKVISLRILKIFTWTEFPLVSLIPSQVTTSSNFEVRISRGPIE